MISSSSHPAPVQFRRLRDNAQRNRIDFTIDGRPCEAKAGDTLMTAMLLSGRAIRASDIDSGMRAGLCLMAACQDCWVWIEGGRRVRACSTLIENGMAVLTTDPEFDQ